VVITNQNDIVFKIQEEYKRVQFLRDQGHYCKKTGSRISVMSNTARLIAFTGEAHNEN